MELGIRVKDKKEFYSIDLYGDELVQPIENDYMDKWCFW